MPFMGGAAGFECQERAAAARRRHWRASECCGAGVGIMDERIRGFSRNCNGIRRAQRLWRICGGGMHVWPTQAQWVAALMGHYGHHGHLSRRCLIGRSGRHHGHGSALGGAAGLVYAAWICGCVHVHVYGAGVWSRDMCM